MGASGVAQALTTTASASVASNGFSDEVFWARVMLDQRRGAREVSRFDVSHIANAKLTKIS